MKWVLSCKECDYIREPKNLEEEEKFAKMLALGWFKDTRCPGCGRVGTLILKTIDTKHPLQMFRVNDNTITFEEMK